jgi:hypothetical protein
MSCATQTQTLLREVVVIKRKSQDGQALIFMALAMPVLLGVVGLAFDVGFLEMMQRQAQTAADSAAIAGAVSLPYGHATTGAQAGALKNGFPNSAVTVNNPPSIGPNAGNTSAVEVIISQAEPTFFMRMVGAGASTLVKARAVATNLAGDCIFALSPTAGPTGTINPYTGVCNNCGAALFVGGNSLINVSGCGVEVDSRTAGSLWLEWGNILTNYLGDAASTYGCGYSTPPVGAGDPGCYDPTYPVVTMYPQPAPALSDPLAYLSPPGTTTCTSGGLYVMTGGTNYSSHTYNITPGTGGVPSCPDVVISQNPPYGPSTVTFNPGTYHSITVGDCPPGGYCYLPDSNVTFASGVYSILGSAPASSGSGVNTTYYCIPVAVGFTYTSSIPPCSLAVTGSGATVQGSNLTFYFGPNAGGLAMDGYFCYGCTSNSINLAATTTGAYAGILFFQDRSNSYAACIGGCSSFPTGQPNYFLISGAMYFPDANLYLTGCCETAGGGAATNTYQINVANTLFFQFDNFYSNYSSLPGGSPIKKTSLIE